MARAVRTTALSQPSRRRRKHWLGKGGSIALGRRTGTQGGHSENPNRLGTNCPGGSLTLGDGSLLPIPFGRPGPGFECPGRYWPFVPRSPFSSLLESDFPFEEFDEFPAAMPILDQRSSFRCGRAGDRLRPLTELIARDSCNRPQAAPRYLDCRARRRRPAIRRRRYMPRACAASGKLSVSDRPVGRPIGRLASNP